LIHTVNLPPQIHEFAQLLLPGKRDIAGQTISQQRLTCNRPGETSSAGADDVRCNRFDTGQGSAKQFLARVLSRHLALQRLVVQRHCATFDQRIYRGTINTPKTQKSKRLAAVSSGLSRDLEESLGRDPDGRSEDWLFPSEKVNTPLAKDNVMLRHIRPALKTIGFDWVDFHVLRRTHSSLMCELGVDLRLWRINRGILDVN